MIEDPRTADDYSDRTTAAVQSVLVEIGQILGSYKGKFAIVGGSVPNLMLKNAEMKHVGTNDIDIALNAEALKEDDEYVDLVNSLIKQGYEQRKDKKVF